MNKHEFQKHNGAVKDGKSTEIHGLKRKDFSLPVEEHSTAAWANIEKTKPISKVPIPSELDVELAREWVEENQK
ncbi:MAG: DUF3787 domain-containing protein [Firmicutes bacterium]|jgi:hypothetical protein|nr:DUF3787 domain-containing protein [Bacillota bacterium]